VSDSDFSLCFVCDMRLDLVEENKWVLDGVDADAIEEKLS
jgi:hypothetical protein